MLVRLVQSLNADFPIFFTDGGMMMLAREEQSENAKSPISVSNSGMLMFLREEQSRKVNVSIFVTDSGMLILIREEQPENAPAPISVTDGGILTLVREELSLKAWSSIFVTDSDMMPTPYFILYLRVLINALTHFLISKHTIHITHTIANNPYVVSATTISKRTHIRILFKHQFNYLVISENTVTL